MKNYYLSPDGLKQFEDKQLAELTAQGGFINIAGPVVLPLALEPSCGEEVQKLVAEIYATPRPIIDRAKKFFAPK